MLGTFVSEAFYADDAELTSGAGTGELHHGIPRYGDAVAVWADLSRDRHGPETNGRSKSRPQKAIWIAAELKRLSREAPAETDFGVIAFYRAQVQAIWTALEAAHLAARTASGQYQTTGALADRLHVGTVDAFQGRWSGHGAAAHRAGTGSCIRVEPPIGVAAGDDAGCEVRGPYVAEAGRFGQAVSRLFLRLRRSLRLARFIAMVMRGAASLGKPAGSPRLRSVIRVERSLMACQV